MKYFLLLILSTLVLYSGFSQSEAARLNDLGYEAYKKHQYDVASDLFFRAIQADNRNVYAHHNYACMLALNNWRTDINLILSHLKQEITLNPKRLEKILIDPDLDTVRNKKEFIHFILDGSIQNTIRTGQIKNNKTDIGYEFVFHTDGTLQYSDTSTGFQLKGRWARIKESLAVYIPGLQKTIVQSKSSFYTQIKKNKTDIFWGTLDLSRKIISIEYFSFPTKTVVE